MTEPTDARERANARLAEAETDRVAWRDRSIAASNRAGQFRFEAEGLRDRLAAAETRCAELEASEQAWERMVQGLDARIDAETARLAEAEELLREINAATFDTRNLAMDDYEWRVSAFLAEGDT